MNLFKIVFFCAAIISFSYLAQAREACQNPTKFGDVADELSALGPAPDRDMFGTISAKLADLGLLTSPDPICFRYLIKKYIANLKENYDAEDVQKYLVSENPMFVSPDECQAQNTGEYVKFGNEMGNLGPNPSQDAIIAAQSKYDYLYDKSDACRKIVMIALRQAFKQAGFYDTEEGRAYLNKMDPVGWIMEDSREQE